jgi:hypothetical protein
MTIIVKHRWTNAVLLEVEAVSLRLAIVNAVSTGADLTEADLTGADLTGANLTGANLRGANLRGADLTEADLTEADLREADLTGADLTEADLTGADLTEADLTGANLTGANLTGANLRGANLTPIRDDLWAVLCASPHEVLALRQSLVEGRINGSSYEGDCACLVGTLANARHCTYEEIPGLQPDSSRPAECFFSCIKIGDTPATSQFSQLALEWVDQWLANMQAAFGTVKP